MWTRVMQRSDRQRKTLLRLLMLVPLLYVGGYDSSIQLSGPQLPVGPPGRAATAPTAFTPFLDIVPSDDGADLYIRASGVAGPIGDMIANVSEGPTRHRGSYTMTYSDTAEVYVATATGFTPSQDTTGTVSITTTLGLATPVVSFQRAYVPASTTETVQSSDGNLELSFVTPGTLLFNTYIAVVPSYAPPGPAPDGSHFIGNSYSVRASGALTLSDKPMSLSLYYTDAALGSLDAHSLAVFAWDAAAHAWINRGGQVFANHHFVSTTVSSFTTYALMATTVWRDDFNDLGGLDGRRSRNTTVGLSGDQIALVLDATPGNGEAISTPISPPVLDAWGTLTFAASRPPDTGLAVDVLSEDGAVLRADVASGVSLADLDAARYPRLRLRARLTSPVAGVSPGLSSWQVTWRVASSHVYLPYLAVAERASTPGFKTLTLPPRPQGAGSKVNGVPQRALRPG